MNILFSADGNGVARSFSVRGLTDPRGNYNEGYPGLIVIDPCSKSRIS